MDNDKLSFKEELGKNGYSREEEYFYQINQELIRALKKAQKSQSPKENKPNLNSQKILNGIQADVLAKEVSVIAHELRNPLSAALMAISLLRRDTAIPIDRNKLLDIAATNLLRLNELIAGVSLTEKLKVSSIDVHPIDMSLEDFMTPILDSSKLIALGKQTEFITRFNSKTHFYADRSLSESALRNLIDNAIKFADHGTISIEIEEKGNNLLVFHVRDQCDGIPSEELGNIFEPFKRGPTKKPGSGLGLAIARRSIEIQCGEIFAESEPGKGCHFWFTLPKEVQKAA